MRMNRARRVPNMHVGPNVTAILPTVYNGR